MELEALLLTAFLQRFSVIMEYYNIMVREGIEVAFTSGIYAHGPICLTVCSSPILSQGTAGHRHEMWLHRLTRFPSTGHYWATGPSMGSGIWS